VAEYALPEKAGAGQGDCGQPRSSGSAVTSTECLFFLQAAIGSQTCTPECICDVVGSGFPFDCSCGDTTTIYPLTFANIEIRDGTNPTTCPAGFSTFELHLFAEDELLEARWNWALVHSDGSRGVHNPSFVLEVLDASIDALQG
jgi:hypothetical protein